MKTETPEIIIGTITATNGQRQRLTRVGDKIRTTPIDKKGLRRDGFRHDYTPAEVLDSVAKGARMTIENEAEAIASGLVVPPAAPAAMPRLDGANEKILQAIESVTAGQDRITWDSIGAAVNNAVTIPKGGWMKVRGVLQYMIDHGRLVRDSDFLNNETYLTDVETAKHTALLFASYAYIDNLSNGFPGAKVIEFDPQGHPGWYALELGGKILTIASGIFKPRAALLPVRYPEDL